MNWKSPLKHRTYSQKKRPHEEVLMRFIMLNIVFLFFF